MLFIYRKDLEDSYTKSSFWMSKQFSDGAAKKWQILNQGAIRTKRKDNSAFLFSLALNKTVGMILRIRDIPYFSPLCHVRIQQEDDHPKILAKTQSVGCWHPDLTFLSH